MYSEYRGEYVNNFHLSDTKTLYFRKKGTHDVYFYNDNLKDLGMLTLQCRHHAPSLIKRLLQKDHKYLVESADDTFIDIFIYDTLKIKHDSKFTTIVTKTPNDLYGFLLMQNQSSYCRELIDKLYYIYSKLDIIKDVNILLIYIISNLHLNDKISYKHYTLVSR